MTESGAAPAAYIRGVPHPLPAGEHVLWEGAPAAGAVANHVYHRRLIALYFAGMLAWWMADTTETFGSSAFFAGLGVPIGLSVIVLVIVETLARVTARTTWYAITNKRIVLKIGMVVPMSINLPFSRLQSAGIAVFKDGTGQILLTPQKEHRLAYIALWPHCRVWKINHPQPLLRGLVDAKSVGAILATAIAAPVPDQQTRIERTAAQEPTLAIGALGHPVGA